jgi:hypothetical protein
LVLLSIWTSGTAFGWTRLPAAIMRTRRVVRSVALFEPAAEPRLAREAGVLPALVRARVVFCAGRLPLAREVWVVVRGVVDSDRRLLIRVSRQRNRKSGGRPGVYGELASPPREIFHQRIELMS